MPNFAWTAKNRFGQPIVREISSETAEQAKAQLLAEGCTDIALQENEVMTTVTGAMRKPKMFGDRLKITAADRLQARNRPPVTFWRAFCDSVARTALICSIVGIFEIYQIYERNWLPAVLAPSALLLYLLALVCIRLPSMYHKKLFKALDWHRWDEALKLVARLRQINRIHFIKVPNTALMRYRAKALAGSGKLTQALEEYAVCENLPGCPSWLYKTMVADIYDTAKMYDKALDMVRQSLAEKPRPSVYIGLATRLLRCKADVAEVKAALVQAEKGELIEDIEKPTVLQCHGLVASLENDLPQAEQDFRAALEILERTRHMPFREGHISRTRARLCCVLAKRGDLQEARTLFAAAEEYLVATGSTDLLEECKRALAGA